MTAIRQKVASFVDQMPDADRPGRESKFTGPAPEIAACIVDGILEGGRESLVELCGLIRDAVGGGEKNYKPGYTLHAIALHVGRPGKEKERRLFAETLASLLGSAGPPKDVRSFLIRELQVAGGKEVVPALAQALEDDELCEFAAQALVAIGDGAGDAIRAAWGKVGGRNRVTIAQSLGAVRAADGIDLLEEASRDEDPDVRAASVWALAAIGAVEAAEPVLRAADGSEGWERIKATQACLLLAENLRKSGDEEAARRIYTHLRDTRKDPGERYVREAAERGLEGRA